MKKLCILMALFMAGCVATPPPTVPVCARPMAVDSVICSIATKINMTPEQIDSMFLDAALVGIGTKVISASELRTALEKTRTWVLERNILNIQGLTNYLLEEATMDKALAMLLSRRLGLINLPVLGLAPLTPYDIELIVTGLDHQLEQLRFF